MMGAELKEGVGRKRPGGCSGLIWRKQTSTLGATPDRAPIHFTASDSPPCTIPRYSWPRQCLPRAPGRPPRLDPGASDAVECSGGAIPCGAAARPGTPASERDPAPRCLGHAPGRARDPLDPGKSRSACHHRPKRALGNSKLRQQERSDPARAMHMRQAQERLPAESPSARPRARGCKSGQVSRLSIGSEAGLRGGIARGTPEPPGQAHCPKGCSGRASRERRLAKIAHPLGPDACLPEANCRAMPAALYQRRLLTQPWIRSGRSCGMPIMRKEGRQVGVRESATAAMRSE